MQCRNCGTEIADKALICYRCGTATTEAKFKPSVPRRGSSTAGPFGLVASVLALALLVLLALYLGRVPSGEHPRLLTWVAVSIAVIIVALRAYGRRR
jgi:hypothetical protein